MTTVYSWFLIIFGVWATLKMFGIKLGDVFAIQLDGKAVFWFFVAFLFGMLWLSFMKL